MGKYKFLLASEDDIPEILSLYSSLIGTPGCTWSADYPNEETAETDVKNSSLYLLRDDSQIIAVATAGSDNELDGLPWTLKNPCELARIGVLTEVQNQGVGSMILQKVIEAVKARGFDGIRMLVGKNNPAALALYHKHGFKRCGETFMFGWDYYCYQMEFITPQAF